MFRTKPYPEVFFSGELLPVAQAIKARDMEQVISLASQLDNIDAPGRENFTLLAFAVADTNIPAIKVLMELGATPAIKLGERGERGTIAYFAMWRKTTEALKALLDAGMDPNLQDGDRTLIYKVPNLEDNDALKLLVEYGADVNARDRLGETVLFKMIRVKFDEALYVLEHGAEPFVMDKAGVTTAHLVQDALASMDKSSQAYQKMLKIQQKMIEMGVQFPALSPWGERVRNDIVFCADPEGFCPRTECKVLGDTRFWKEQSEESKRLDEQILRERYGMDVKL